jgi:hypothetical protein
MAVMKSTMSARAKVVHYAADVELALSDGIAALQGCTLSESSMKRLQNVTLLDGLSMPASLLRVRMSPRRASLKFTVVVLVASLA